MNYSVATQIEDRFLRYVQIDTQSSEASLSVPSTAKQYDLLNLLADELREMGAEDVVLTDYACVLATIPATIEADVPTIAFLAHVDTAPEFSGKNVKPLVHRSYAGRPIVLPDDTNQVLDPAVFPYLAEKVGEDVVTASGTTLLGADDKAGVAIVMTMAQTLLKHPEIPHGRVRVCFTPDEEVGRGVANLSLEDLDADFGYTLDGGKVGQIDFETFSADKATITITGVAVHPGYAKGQMVNALHLAGKLIDRLPQDHRSPATTSGYEGFLHLYKVEGNNSTVTLHIILRDFNRNGLADERALIQQICADVQALEPRATVDCTIAKQYRNMRYWLDDDMRPVELAVSAAKQIGIKPFHKPTRGGTDGSRLTEMGLPTPNLFTGMQNFHGPLEWVSIQDMEKATNLCVQIVAQQ